MNDVLRVAVVGAGYFGQFHLDAWQRLEGVELAVIVEHNESCHTQLQEQFPKTNLCTSIEQAARITQLDYLDIVTPPATHANLIQQALAHTADDCVLLCQKPFCESLSEAQQIAALLEQQNRTLVIHENFRFQPWYAKIKSLLDEHALGEILQARFLLRPGDGQGDDAYLDRQPYFRKMPRFLIRETGIHWIDTFRYLFGEPKSVYAELQKINPVIAGEDAGIFILRYENGMAAIFDANRHLDHNADNRRLTMGELVIEGTEATLSLDGDGVLSLRRFGQRQSNAIDYAYNCEEVGGDSVYRLISHVIAHRRTGSQLQNTAAEYLRNLELQELIYRSAEQGTRLDC